MLNTVIGTPMSLFAGNLVHEGTMFLGSIRAGQEER